MVGLGSMPGPGLEFFLKPPGRSFGTSRDGDQVEPQRRQLSRPPFQSHSREVSADAARIQVGVRARVHVPSEHAGSYQRDLYSAIHPGRHRENAKKR